MPLPFSHSQESIGERTLFYPLALALLAAVLFFPGLGARDFWAPGEPIYAEIVRVMFERSEWTVPTVNGQLYTDKPILYFWLALVFSKLAGGVSEWTVRLPSALGGLGLVLVTYYLGKAFYNRQTGFLAGIVLATSSRVLWESRFLRLDTVLSFLLLLGFYFFLKAFLNRSQKNLYLFSYLCFALATLTKGPIGIVLPGLTALCLLVLGGRWGELTQMRLFSGFVIFALVVLPWLWLLHIKGEDQWLRDFILVHNVQNYALEPIGHVRPFYYYILNLPMDFLPWSLLIPGALLYYYPWRERLWEPATLAMFCWFAVIFFFFSASKSKIAYYLLPLLPVLALLAGGYLKDLFAEEPKGSFHWNCTALLLYVLAALMLSGGMALPFVALKFEPGLFVWALVAALILVIGSAGMIGVLRQKKIQSCFWILTAVLACSFFVSSVKVFPYLDKYKSARPLGEFIRHDLPAKAPVYIYQSNMSDFNYYARRETISVLTSAEAVQKASLEPMAYLLINEKDLKKIGLGRSQRIIAEHRLGERKWYLIKLSRDGL